MLLGKFCRCSVVGRRAIRQPGEYRTQCWRDGATMARAEGKDKRLATTIKSGQGVTVINMP